MAPADASPESAAASSPPRDEPLEGSASLSDRSWSIPTLLLLGIGCALLGMLPWIVTGMRLPLQNLWEGPPPADGMPIALLPFSQYAVGHIVAVLTSGSLFAGIAARTLRRRAGFRVWPVLLGVAAVQVVALVQTALTVGAGLQDRTESLIYVAGLSAGTAFTIALGLGVLVIVARAPVGWATVAIAVVAYPASRWFTGLILPFGSEALPNAFQAAAFSFFPWVPAVIFGVLLAWCGLRPPVRIAAWLFALAALWVMPAFFAAVGSALGARVLATRPAEMLDYGVGVFSMAVSGQAGQWAFLVVALIIGLVGTAARELIARSRLAASSR